MKLSNILEESKREILQKKAEQVYEILKSGTFQRKSDDGHVATYTYELSDNPNILIKKTVGIDGDGNGFEQFQDQPVITCGVVVLDTNRKDITKVRPAFILNYLHKLFRHYKMTLSIGLFNGDIDWKTVRK